MPFRFSAIRFSADSTAPQVPDGLPHGASARRGSGPGAETDTETGALPGSEAATSAATGNDPINFPVTGAQEKTSGKNAKTAQPSSGSRVEKDMATLVMDSPGLGTGLRVNNTIESEAEHNPRSRAVVTNPEAEERDDATIMLAVAAGDEAGYSYLANKYHRQIIHFLYRMVRNEAIAEELAQEVFLRVYRSRSSYRAEAKFSTWLYRIATNLAMNHVRDSRQERAAQKVNLDEPDPETGTTPEIADQGPSVEQRLLREERMAAIRAQVTSLPERQRMAILMHKYQEMDYRQIGEVLQLSESATKSLLFRAYQTLRERLKEFI